MSPQFVDFDADGHLDIVAGIFDGSPHVALGSAAGFEQPRQILDRDGARIVLNQFWNFDTKKWDETTRCDPAGGAPARGHLTSAWAADMDGDGDLDLLLGDYDGGYVYLRTNEGSRTEPAFGTRNTVVTAAGAPLAVPGKLATLRLIDWDRDGVDDLLLGGMGDTWSEGEGGGVFVCRNTGTNAAPVFGKPVALIPASPKGATAPTRPDAGLYMDAGDHDGDGDLDLIVGGYSLWTPEPPKLDAEQKARVATLQEELDELNAASRAFSKELAEAASGLEPEAAAEKRKQLLEERGGELATQSKRRAAIEQELEPLVPGRKRVSFVWLYENLAAPASRPTGGDGAR